LWQPENCHAYSGRYAKPKGSTRAIDPGCGAGRMDDNDNRLFGVTAQIAWRPKPAFQLTVRTPLCAMRNQLRSRREFGSDDLIFMITGGRRGRRTA
jgi:hypothetical protein